VAGCVLRERVTSGNPSTAAASDKQQLQYAPLVHLMGALHPTCSQSHCQLSLTCHWRCCFLPPVTCWSAALPASIALPWLHTRPITSIPQLQRKTGTAVVQGLSVQTVGELQGFAVQELQAQFGATTAALLQHLPLGSGGSGTRSPVRERGPAKQVTAGRSCQPLNA
jgi:hypothetical protein